MNAQILIADCLQVCRPSRRSVFKQVGPVACLALLIASSVLCGASAAAEDYSLIIEKNLFHNQRQKWEMEKSQAKGASSQAGQKDRGDIDKINLFGTVIKDSQSYAVMRVNQAANPRTSSRRALRRASRDKDRKQSGTQGSGQGQDSKRPYSVGDFISGYQIVEIRSESVLLQDPYDSKQYEIFMNDGQTDRTAVRTEIAEEKPEKTPKVSRKEKKTPRRDKNRPGANSKASTDALRKRFERDLKNLRDGGGDEAAERRAERDWKKLEPMINSLDDQGRQDLERLKSEFENLRK
jgi:hypothetical protein